MIRLQDVQSRFEELYGGPPRSNQIRCLARALVEAINEEANRDRTSTVDFGDDYPDTRDEESPGL
jgi:hypothetical protein